ncbi:hypothetical protein BDF20DRAFT_937786 [Mycotypha africana]|uniref:uncharacterized protein n=1 Tax=Mycotypha africana TaxID=64632 RepID=UPI002301B3A8|nr:uncharacterized protein BDF20DRAFT_937786 [Mycotypha africana]KAI8982143.1 hypothetical protein BDF20DRAFT_937786 [Mycotypha africana]
MKNRYDKRIHVRRQFIIGEQCLLFDHYKENKFPYVWIGPMTVIKVNNNGTYHLSGPNARRLDGAVNREQLLPYIKKNRMLPDVEIAKNNAPDFQRLTQHLQQYAEVSNAQFNKHKTEAFSLSEEQITILDVLTALA